LAAAGKQKGMLSNSNQYPQHHKYCNRMSCGSAKPVPQLLLKAASDIPLPILDYLRASVHIQNKYGVNSHHDFIVVSDLIATAILN